MARRLDRDGARLEQYTKKQKAIPVGGAVAVQNQTGRFPKKWDKTGVVVENMDHDKVLVRMDGSRRLTTRNRRFVKQILSPPDLPDLDVPSGPVQGQVSSPVVDSVDEALTTQLADMSDNTSSLGGLQQGTSQYQSNTGVEMSDDGAPDIDSVQDDEMGQEVQPMSPVPSCGETVGRPQRDRRPNVRYRSDEYDLSSVSASNKCLLLSGLYVNQGRPRNRGRC